jgi:type II secretory pathway component PulF
MPHYRYQALNADRQPVAGELAADSLAQVVAQLEAQGLTVQSIVDVSSEPSAAGPAAMNPGGDNPFASPTAIERAAAEQAALRLHMEQVIERGRDLLPPLRAYAAEMPAGVCRRELEAVLRVLGRGDAAAASTALAALPGYWIPLLSAATSSRDPARVLREFLQESQRAGELSRQWWLALAYPAFLAGIAVLVMAALSFLVIPIFRDIFAGFGLELPWLTLIVITVSDWFTSGRIVLPALVVVALAVLLVKGRQLLPAGLREWFGDRFGLLWGRSNTLARLAQFTADLLEAELNPAHALRLAGMATNRGAIRRAAWRVASNLESPWLAAAADPAALRRSRRVLSATVLHALQSPLSTTARVRLLREVSGCHADRARIRLSWTRGFLEPVAICAIGLIVGVTVLALFMPLFTLIHGLS